MTTRYGAQLCAGVWIGLSVISCGGAQQPVDNSLDSNESESVVGNPGPEGDSGLTLGDTRYPLDAAIGDIWGPSNSHFQINYTLTDGNFTFESVLIDGQSYELLSPTQASAVFHARVFSPGGSFEYISYAFVADSSLPMQGVGYFTDAYVGIDQDVNGSVDSNEQLSVIDGIIEFTGIASDIELNISVTLSDGQTVDGHYSGLLDLFDFTER